MKRTSLTGLAAILVLLMAAVYFSQGSYAPKGQPPLVEMDNRALSALQSEFKPPYARHLNERTHLNDHAIWRPRKSCVKTEESRRAKLRELIFGGHPNGEQQSRA